MRLDDLAARIGASVNPEDASAEVSRIVTDSRRVTPSSVFVAMKGEHADGNDYIESAACRGAAAVITERHPPLGAQLPQLIVPDARAAMRKAAWAVWGDAVRDAGLIGITGTNGKTTVAWLVRDMLAVSGRKAGLIGTLGVDPGDGLRSTGYTTPETAELLETIADMRSRGIEWVAMEVSSHALALGRVDGLEFRAAVFTNLSREHLDFHRSIEGYLDAKAMLFERLDETATAVLNRDDASAAALSSRTRARILWTGVESEADVRVTPLAPREAGSRRVAIEAFGGRAELLWQPPGAHNLENLASAAGAALTAGVELDDVARAAGLFAGVPGRLERIDCGQPFEVLVDYAHTPEGLRRVLDSLREEVRGRLICVFGCGGDRDRTKRPLMGRIAEERADFLVITADNPRSESPESIAEEIKSGLRDRGRAVIEHDREKAIGIALDNARDGDLVLIAGKGHESEQIVGERRFPFDDRVVAREKLDCLLHSKGGHW